MSLSYSINFSAPQLDTIDRCLGGVYQDTNAKCVMLADSSGQFISKRGQISDQEMAVLAALAAAQLSATQEIARLVGERNRFKLLQEGQQQSVYLLDINLDLILVVVFGTQTPLGMVRLVIRQAVEQLRQIAEEAHASGPDTTFDDDDFAKLLVDQLDDMLLE